jgi:hypothetical protein
MSWRQHMMAPLLTAILLAVVIATAAIPQNPATATSQVEMRIEPRAPKALLITRSNMTSRAKIPLQQTWPLPYEIASTRDQGAVWAQGPVYDLTRTSRASIYVFYTPDPGE